MYSPYVTFVVLTVDHFVGCVDGPLERQKQESRVFRKKWHVMDAKMNARSNYVTMVVRHSESLILAALFVGLVNLAFL